ncbi:recombinase family protein [Variovorax boronicumulans]|uniref:Recombinase family protein n=1 Tax=Variovorax boronicumulans TaxID=436515 RepID=A0A250DKV6_9BURK|nr:recombinase family protein [Variovorax boronicumulans]ATA54599.1 recombinase family protein [Variovorax boronicumulans]
MSGLVYSYSRFSDPRQAKGSSLERQAAYAARWAAEHGLKLDESLTLRDEGLSAYHQKHVKSGALGVFLAAVESGKVPPGSVLVVEGLDRLSRAEPIQAQGQLAQIVNAGITVVTASDGKAYSRERLKANPMDLVYSLLVMIRAHEESDTKSKRVTASIVRQCQGWIAGTYRGLIRNGKDPLWVELVDGKWQLIPERVEAVRAALDLYRRGYSATRILDAMADLKLSLTGQGLQTLQIYRLIRQRALLGEKELEVDGQQFHLPGYYPALLTEAEWSELQALAAGRGRRVAKGAVPHIITGMRITICGYCGRALVGQNIGTRNRRPDGGILDGHRRLHCTSYSHEGGCPVPGSCSVAPIERALMAYCSDMINLQALYGGDRAAAPRATLAAARARHAELAVQLERLTDAMLAAADDGGAPATFAKRARALEAEQATVAADIAAAERDLAAVARTDLQGVDEIWRKLAAGVEAQDTDARIQARQLVADTFEKIVIYKKGVDPETAPDKTIDLLLLAKGGTARPLRIDAKGNWVAAEASTETPPLID